MAESRIVGSIQADTSVSANASIIMVQGKPYTVSEWLLLNSGAPVPVVMVDGLSLAVGHSNDLGKYLSAISSQETLIQALKKDVESATVESRDWRLLAETSIREKDAMARDLQHEGEIRRSDAAGLEEMKNKVFQLETQLSGEKAQYRIDISEKQSTIDHLRRDEGKVVVHANSMSKWAKLMVCIALGVIVILMIKESYQPDHRGKDNAENYVNDEETKEEVQMEDDYENSTPEPSESDPPTTSEKEEEERPRKKRDNARERPRHRHHKTEGAKHRKHREPVIHKVVHHAKPMRSTR